MSFFLITFFIVYGGMHVYAFSKANLALSLGISASIPLSIFMAFMVLAPVAIRLVEGAGHESSARLLAWIGYSWMGLLLIFTFIALSVDAYRLAVILGGLMCGIAPSSYLPSATKAFYAELCLASVMAVYAFFNAQNIRVEKISLKNPKIPAETGMIKIAQISDMHVGLINGEKMLAGVADIIRKTAPDILVSTGDLIDGQSANIKRLAGILKDVQPRLGKYAVIGNHEYYAGLENSVSFMRAAGFIVLRGTGTTSSGIINIAGVDDEAGKRFEQYNDTDEEKMLSSLPSEIFTIFLKHRPVVDENSTGLFDLQLSGHTHGGQILPPGMTFRLFYPNFSGLKELNNSSYLYTSRGTGSWGPPMRLFSPPEVTIIEISR